MKKRQSDNNRIRIRLQLNLHYISGDICDRPSSSRLAAQVTFKAAKQLWFSIYILLFNCCARCKWKSDQTGVHRTHRSHTLRVLANCWSLPTLRIRPVLPRGVHNSDCTWGVCCQFLHIKSLTLLRLSCKNSSSRGCEHLVWVSMSAIKDEIKTCLLHCKFSTHISWVDIWIDIFRQMTIKCSLKLWVNTSRIQVEYSWALLIHLVNRFSASSLPKSFDATAPHGKLSKNPSKNEAQGCSLAFKDTFT